MSIVRTGVGGTQPQLPAKTSVTTKASTTAGGYLVDNRGNIHDLSVWAAKSILEFVEPSYETGDGKLPVWATDKGGDRFTKTTTYKTNVNACVYNAVKECMQSLGIGTLTPGDKAFFTNHPRVSTDGVNKANVLAVAHGLAVPWGVGITRVFVPKMSTLGDQHKEFAAALGVNPLALQTYNASNEDFIASMEIDPTSDEANMVRRMFRFEFVDAPKKPCVVMMASSGTTVKKGGTTVGGNWSSTTSGVGHADFIGPRDGTSDSWKIAFQLGPLPEYNDVGGKSINRYENVRDAFDADEFVQTVEEKFSTWNSLINGKSVSQWDTEYRAAHPYKPTVVQSQFVKPHTPTQKNTIPPKNGVPQGSTARISTTVCKECGGMVATIDGVSYCLACDWYEDGEEVAAGIEEVCPFCYSSIDDTGKCTNKECGFDKMQHIQSTYFICSKHGTPLHFYTKAAGKDGDKYQYMCPECLYTDGENLATFIDDGRTHPRELVQQVRYVGGGEDDKKS